MIKQALERLKEEERKKLIFALNEGIPYHVIMENNTFIGVNIIGTVFEILETHGSWSYGVYHG